LRGLFNTLGPAHDHQPVRSGWLAGALTRLGASGQSYEQRRRACGDNHCRFHSHL